MHETKVGDTVLVKKSWALCGIMDGNEYEVLGVDGTSIAVSNGAFFSSLDSKQGDEWEIVNASA